MRRIPFSKSVVSVGLVIGALMALSSFTGCGEDDTPTATSLFKAVRVPGDIKTIQAAIDFAEGGDTILVADGTFSGLGNRDLQITNKILVIMSENGPENTIIDCGGSADAEHGGFTFEQVGHKGTVLDGFTIRNAYRNEGAAVLLSSSSPRISNCLFVNNHSTTSGGAIKMKSSSPTISNCTIVHNSCNSGAAIFGLATSKPKFVNCIIAYNDSSDVMVANESTTDFDLECCNVFGNSHGDFVGDIASMASASNNFSGDPLFCEDGFDFSLESGSPCAASLSPCGAPIGAFAVGCQSPLK